METIKDWKCICGNVPHDAGYFSCDDAGARLENGKEQGLYLCGKCGRIINGETGEVVGQADITSDNDDDDDS